MVSENKKKHCSTMSLINYSVSLCSIRRSYLFYSVIITSHDIHTLPCGLHGYSKQLMHCSDDCNVIMRRGTYFPSAKHSSLTVELFATGTTSGNCTSIFGSYSPITPVVRKRKTVNAAILIPICSEQTREWKRTRDTIQNYFPPSSDFNAPKNRLTVLCKYVFYLKCHY